MDKTSIPLTAGSLTLSHKYASSPFVFGLQASQLWDRQYSSTHFEYGDSIDYYRHDYKSRMGLLLRPMISRDWEIIGVSVGMPIQVYASEKSFPTGQSMRDRDRWTTSAYIPSSTLRFGSLKGIHIVLGIFDTNPYFTGNGFDGVVRIPSSNGSILSFGYCQAGTYDGVGVIGRFEMPLNSTLSADLMVRLGSGGGLDESGVGLGIKKVWNH